METYFTANVCIGMLLFSIVASVTSRGIHNDMTRAELLQTFDVTENLPEYEIVPIHYSHVNKRAIDGQVSIHLKPFGKEISLWLEPAEGVLFSDETPVYTLSYSSKGREYIKHKDKIRSYSSYLYTNLKTFTTLAVSRRSNYGKRMVGMIGSENLVIRSLPERFYTSLRYGRASNEIPKSEQNDHHYHIVYRSAINNTLERFKSSIRTKRAIQDTIYPEILVIVDSSLYNVFGGHMVVMILYLMAFWNGVDMMFRPLESPKFRLNIAAVILVEDNTALDYISSNRIESDGFYYKKALNESQNWLHEYLPSDIDKNSYDVAVTMTKLEFCGVKNNLKQCGVTVGIAYESGACKIDEDLHEISKTSLIHDNGGFNGIVSTGHELGHLFGADHDGEKNSINCSSTTGNIMTSNVNLIRDTPDWSKCSLIAFGSFLEDKGKCLYNLPKHSGNVPRLLPGKMEDAHKQCKYREGTKSYSVDETICQKLLCYKKGNDSVLRNSGAAVDGTPCGYQKMCLHNQCILESLVMQS